MFHIVNVPRRVESCPLTKLNGGLSRLHSADEDAVNQGILHLSNYEGCLIRPSEAKLHPTYSKLATALVKLQFSVNLLLTG